MDTARTLGTVGGWAVVIGAAATFWWVNNQRKNKNRRTAPSKSTGKTVEPRKEHKTKKARKDGGSDQDVKQGKKKAAQSAKTEEKAYTTAVDVNEKNDDEVDNREFARQLSSVKSGTVMAAKSQSSSRPKSVKQTRAQEKPAVEISSDNATAPSSTTGADADDDQSPINSPDLSATSMAPVAKGDVSDMLEQPTAGPQVLKIVPSTNPTPAKKAKQQKPIETKETKKQRQNRQKAEAQRLAREEDEKARKVLEEKQRRTAREAEGRSAKDGSGFMASQAPSPAVWTAPPSAVNGTKPTANLVELLDTYEPSKISGSTVEPEETVYSPSEVAGSQLAKEYGGLSEEEQIRIIQEESEEWKTVQSKEKKKKRNIVKETADSQDEKKASTNESKEYGIPPVIAPTGPGQAWSLKTVHVEPVNKKVVEREVEVQDSEWEVA